MMGKCCLCGEFRELSFEHFPPRSAYNKGRFYEAIDFMDWVKDKGTWEKKKKIRGALGAYTLCKGCNNMAGRYAKEYKEWVKIAVEILEGNNGPKWSGIFPDVYPLRFLKEVVAMFCSLNGPNFAEKNQAIRAFVLSKSSQDIPLELTIFMYLNTSRLITRTGITGLIEFGKPSKIYIVSEYNFPPFGFAIYIGNAKYKQITDITWFAEYTYDEKESIYLELPILERNTPYPADYRSESEIIIDIIKNTIGEVESKYKLNRNNTLKA
jgi:hypothetical protein